MLHSEALCSHHPLSFASKPKAPSEMPQPSASRVLFVSSWKLNSEAARDEPRLRKMLGHISVYDEARAASRSQTQASEEASEDKELSAYLQQQAPSFKAFQAAIEVQLATIAEIKASAELFNTEDDASDEDFVDSDSDIYDGEWSDDETTAESDDSLTDYESTDGQWSPCSSPTSCSGDAKDEEDENDLWAVRPLTTFYNWPVHSS